MDERNLTINLRETDLRILVGDLTELDVDVIVNAANEDLRMENGLGLRILEKAGPAIQDECDRIGVTPPGHAVMTESGDMPVKQIIHAVGPKMGEGEEDRKLGNAVRASLALAERRGFYTIALPMISAGSFGFPVKKSARIMLTEVQRYLQGGTKLELVILCVDDDTTFDIFKNELRRCYR